MFCYLDQPMPRVLDHIPGAAAGSRNCATVMPVAYRLNLRRTGNAGLGSSQPALG
jgi:hypothetical protein